MERLAVLHRNNTPQSALSRYFESYGVHLRPTARGSLSRVCDILFGFWRELTAANSGTRNLNPGAGIATSLTSPPTCSRVAALLGRCLPQYSELWRKLQTLL